MRYAKPRYYEAKRIFECCIDSHCTRVQVHKGQKGELEIFDAPEGFCFQIFKVVWSKCCKSYDLYPVKKECGCPMVAQSGDRVCDLDDTGCGQYEICVTDCDGNPIVPDKGEVVAQFSQSPV